MTIKRSRNPFKRRVNIERKVLGIVNDSLVECEPLVGLTEEAVGTWAAGLKKKYGSCQTDRLVQTVIETSDRLRLNTDRSRDVFSKDEPKRTVSLVALVGLLATFAKDVHQTPGISE